MTQSGARHVVVYLNKNFIPHPKAEAVRKQIAEFHRQIGKYSYEGKGYRAKESAENLTNFLTENRQYLEPQLRAVPNLRSLRRR